MSDEEKTITPTSNPASKKSVPESDLKKPPVKILSADSDVKPAVKRAAAVKKVVTQERAFLLSMQVNDKGKTNSLFSLLYTLFKLNSGI